MIPPFIARALKHPLPTAVGAALAGFALSSATPAGIVTSLLFPTLALRARQRSHSFAVAAAYYCAASWSIVPAARNFFGPHATLLEALFLWLTSSACLAAPWPLAWTRHPNQLPWRAPIALLASAVPPLGLIGWASPLTAAGFLFPGLAAVGLLLCLFTPAFLTRWPGPALFCCASIATIANAVSIHHPVPPLPRWQAINTHFGPIGTSPLQQFHIAQTIQQAALASSATVLVFPETVVPTWTPATDLFWQPVIRQLQRRRATILVGARLPLPTSLQQPFDYQTALQLLQHNQPAMPIALLRSPHDQEFPYDNALIARGADNATTLQMVPVPISMWNPFNIASARLHLTRTPTVRIQNQNAAVLICYEQVISWPILVAMTSRPTVLIAIANDYWAYGTPVPAFQQAAVRSWAALLHIPYLFAANT